jgi:hypothetical protein
MLLLPPRRILSPTETEQVKDTGKSDEPWCEGDQGIGSRMRMTINHEENLDPEKEEDSRRDPPCFRHGIIERTPFPKSRRPKPIFHKTKNMNYPSSIPPCSKKRFPIECVEVLQQPAMTRRNAMARKVQHYIETKDPQAFDAIIGAQHQIGEYPFTDGQIPFVKSQTVDGDDISVLPISTRLLDALHRWNRKHTPTFDFTVYHSENGGLLQQCDAQNHSPVTPKKMQVVRKRRLPIQLGASMIRPSRKAV